MRNAQIHSVLGVGFGPANLSLAIALDEFGHAGSVHFVERSARFQWQSEQLLSGADIQNNPLRDLAMPRDTNSPYSFVKYLASHGRLTDYLHLNAKFPLRREYADYLGWVAGAFGETVSYGESATRIAIERHGDEEVFRVRTETGRSRLGRVLVLGTGRSPRIPPVFGGILGPTAFHSTRYLTSIGALGDRRIRVAVVGGGQSAIEIVLDLLGRPAVEQVTSIQRSIGFRLKDTSPYSRRAFLPEFVDYFHPLAPEAKRRVRTELRTINYAACDQDVIDRLAGLQREYELSGSDRLRIAGFSEVAEVSSGPGGHRLVLQDVNDRHRSIVHADVVILSTGFRDFGLEPGDEPYHPLLAGVADRLALDEDGLPMIARDYSVEVLGGPDSPRPPRLYLNGLCEASHGMGDAGALAMLSVRSADIAQSVMGLPGGPPRTRTYEETRR